MAPGTSLGSAGVSLSSMRPRIYRAETISRTKWTAVVITPECSKKSPHPMRSGAGQAGARGPGGHTTRRLRVTIVHSDALSIS
jgi:hypothetical protein